MNIFKRRLRTLRDALKEQGIDVYIVPNTDPHLGENTHEHWKIIQWLTGFSGSSALVVITKTFAGLWTDSRYFLQAQKQLEGTGFEMMNSASSLTSAVSDWLRLNLKKGGIVAFDGRLVSSRWLQDLKVQLKPKQPVFVTEVDLVSPIWDNRPLVSGSVAFDHSVDFSGESTESKISRVRAGMKNKDVTHHLLNSPADVMWLLNLRASDLRFSPVLMSRAIISLEQVLLFTDESKIPPKLSREFDRLGVVVLPYDELNAILGSIGTGSVLHLSPDETSVSISDSLPGDIVISKGVSIVSCLKSVKNQVECENLRKVMIRDGVAVTRFLKWLDENIQSGIITEEASGRKLSQLRLEQTNCTGESFDPIVAFNEHAALPHYSYADHPETIIGTNGVLLIDSGGQYLDGTTDMTRCIATGKPSYEQTVDYTLVLKGMIKLATARFPVGTRGSRLDVLARKALWDQGINYGHGTGHGVGFFLNVHEAPPTISPSTLSQYDLPLEPGMVVTDEPGIYRAGKYGFRIENMLLVKEDITTGFGSFLSFETLSLCYIDTRLVLTSLLDISELQWLNNYNSEVYHKLSLFLGEEERNWLKKRTNPV